MVRRRLMSAAEITGVPGTAEAAAARICDYPSKSVRSTYLREFLESKSCR